MWCNRTQHMKLRFWQILGLKIDPNGRGSVFLRCIGIWWNILPRKGQYIIYPFCHFKKHTKEEWPESSYKNGTRQKRRCSCRKNILDLPSKWSFNLLNKENHIYFPRLGYVVLIFFQLDLSLRFNRESGFEINGFQKALTHVDGE